MRTKLTITGLVAGIAAATVGIAAGVLARLGPRRGGVLLSAVTSSAAAAYLWKVGPWQHRWGATDEEVARPMPGDNLLPDGKTTTRAITIRRKPEAVWPWLAQLGFGRAGWYSYDWIDNDGRPSARRIVPGWQDLRVGDRVLMIPGLGPEVREIEPNHHLVAGDADGGVWCLALYPHGDRTRLLSRWTQDRRITPGTAFWILVSDPGAFIMERKMLKGIKERAESG